MHLDLGLKDGMHSSVQLVSWTGDGMMMGELANLSPGASVDGTLSYYEDSNIVHHDVITAPWVPGSTGYAGFTFDEGGTTPVYGWMQISFDSSGETFTVEQWAYEDSGAPNPGRGHPGAQYDASLDGRFRRACSDSSTKTAANGRFSIVATLRAMTRRRPASRAIRRDSLSG